MPIRHMQGQPCVRFIIRKTVQNFIDFVYFVIIYNQRVSTIFVQMKYFCSSEFSKLIITNYLMYF